MNIILDIETTARPEAVALLPEPQAPGNWKDPEKIAVEVARKRAEQLAEAALDPDTGSIRAIGLLRCDPVTIAGAERMCGILHTDNDVSEKDVIVWAWGILGGLADGIVGYNIAGFDWPFLLRRSMALGIKPTWLPRYARYQVGPWYDLMEILYGWQVNKYKGLKTVAKLYGISNRCPDISGGDVAGMTDDQLAVYLENDLLMTRDLYNLMKGVYWNE